MSAPDATGRARRTVILCVSIVALMTGLAYAAVPLYDLFCRVTGFAGTTQVGESSQKIVDRIVKVRFDANVSNDLNWDFRPEAREVSLRVGENGLMIYRATNNGRHPVTGTASFNVTPLNAGQYFVKVECFCFEEQTIQPGETVDMPVAYYIDSNIVSDPDMEILPGITLSYTFFEVEEPKRDNVSQSDSAPSLDPAGAGG